MTERQWESRKSLSAARCYASAIPYFGPIPMLRGQSAHVIFVIGGCDRQGTPVNNVDMYLPEKDFWFPLGNMQVARANPICAILNDHYVLAIGGVGNDPPQAPVNAIEIYDVRQNKWFRLPNMTEPLMGMAHLVRNNQLFIFGGMKIDTNPTDSARRLTLKINTNPEQSAQTSVTSSISSGINSYIASLTGASNDSNTLISDSNTSIATDHSTSNISSNLTEKNFQLVWESLPAMPTARYACTSLNFDKYVAVVGGRVGKNSISSFEVYDFTQNLWKIFADHPGHRVFHQIIKLHERIFVLGGLNQPAEQGFSGDVHFYDMAEDSNGKWRSSNKLHYKRGDFAVFTVEADEDQDKFNLGLALRETANAHTGNAPKNVVDVVPEFADMSISRGGVDREKEILTEENDVYDEIYVCGGLGENNGAKALDCCETVSVSRSSGPRKDWKSLPALPEGRGTAIYTKCDGYVYLIGGIMMTHGGDGGPTGKVNRLKL